MVKNNSDEKNTDRSDFPEIRYSYLIIGVLIIAFSGCFFYHIHSSLLLKRYGVQCLAKAGETYSQKKTFEIKSGFRSAFTATQEFRCDTHVWKFDTKYPKDTLVPIVFLPFTPALAVIGKKTDSIFQLSGLNSFRKWVLYCIYSVLGALVLLIILLNYYMFIYLTKAFCNFADDKFKSV